MLVRLHNHELQHLFLLAGRAGHFIFLYHVPLPVCAWVSRRIHIVGFNEQVRPENALHVGDSHSRQSLIRHRHVWTRGQGQYFGTVGNRFHAPGLDLYDATVGPVCYSLITELSSVRLRQKTTVLARKVYNIGTICTGILTPKMLNPGAWDWGAKAGLFWAGMCLLCFMWIFFRLPEPNGRTFWRTGHSLRA